jgi:crotonobetainyl-CoA:carnitine CoA-transferase CaiB-like acyl-CoA transferase
MILPLEGIKIIELGVWVVGPTCARVLGELGADVIKVESPAGGDPARGVVSPRALTQGGRDLGPVSPWWEMWNGSKRSIAVDLAQEAGREIVYKLVQRSDVVIVNMRAPVVDRLGVDYESLSKINPRIIYGQNTGFGPKGPHRDRAAFDDTTFWIRSGLMSTLGEPDGPPVPLRGSMGDLSTALFLSCAIVTALLARDRFGIGQKIDISLLSSGMWVAGDDVQRRLTFGEEEDNPKYTRQSAPNPFRNTYQTKDNKWVFFMMLQTDRFWPAICRAIEREDLEKDQRFDSHAKRVRNRVELIAILDGIMATKTREEWARRFDQYQLIWEPETTVPEALADPQVTANNYVTEVEHPSGTTIKLLRVPFQFSKTPVGPRSAAPELGQHTEEVLLELGYDWNQISQLKEQKVIL